MIKSMTGFGDASAQIDGVSYSVEARSVNNRYFKTNIRMPDELSRLEPDLTQTLKQTISRGTVTLTINIKDDTEAAAGQVNHAVVERYVSTLSELRDKLNNTSGIEINLADLLNLPGAVTTGDVENLVERYRGQVLMLANQACEKLNDLRMVEGKALTQDLISHLKIIEEALLEVQECAPQVVEEYEQRLFDRVKELSAKAGLDYSTPDLIKEVALYAEKCDVAEEVQRLSAHIVQFGEILEREAREPVGRTLDFLAQEMLREANTIASKSNNARISRVVVQIKGAIDRIKEQVQNIE